MKLSKTQLRVLIDIHDGRAIHGKTRTINSLIRKGLIDEDWELTEDGYDTIKDVEFDDETQEIIESSFYLGTQFVKNPENIMVAGLGILIGAFLNRNGR